MKKTCLRTVCILLVLMLASPCALADWARGDRGEGVAQLQQMLFETGWLFEMPDGIFGKNTEAAVKDFENAANLPVDGVADDHMMSVLEESHRALIKEIAGDEGGAGQEAAHGDTVVPVTIAATAVVYGDTVYYAGDPDGRGEGVYQMDRSGSDLRKISDITAVLFTVCDENLLLWNYKAGGYGAMQILRADGSLVHLSDQSSHAIAHNGRFYYGGSSISAQGDDFRMIIASEPEQQNCFYPLEVSGGCLYYLDASDAADSPYFEGYGQPASTVLKRIDLETGVMEQISGDGSRYLGIENGMIYYVREDFTCYDADGGSFIVEVDEGLFSMNLETLAETKLAGIEQDDMVYERYLLIDDGVVYGERVDYSLSEGAFSIIRVDAGGSVLPPIAIAGESCVSLGVENGIYFGLQNSYFETDEGYDFVDSIVLIDIASGMQVKTELSDQEEIIYTEMGPGAVAADGYVYYLVRAKTDAYQALKCMQAEGLEERTLAATYM